MLNLHRIEDMVTMPEGHVIEVEVGKLSICIVISCSGCEYTDVWQPDEILRRVVRRWNKAHGC